MAADRWLFAAVPGRRYLLPLLLGVLIGCSFTVLLSSTVNEETLSLLSPGISDIYVPSDIIGTESQMTEIEDNSEAQMLLENVRVLCWVMTQPANHKKKAVHVKATWGRRCNVLLFISSAADPDLPTVPLSVDEGRDNLWGKTKGAFKYVYRYYLQQVDWVLKADDDTYVVLENLRYMLSDYNPGEALCFGLRFGKFSKEGYMSGGAGYVLSKMAVIKLVEDGLDDASKCRQDNGGFEDVEMGKCLSNLGVEYVDTRDEQGRYRFHPYDPGTHLIPGNIPTDSWFFSYIYYPIKQGMDCCSDTAVSWHYITPKGMYVLEYLIYRLNPYGHRKSRSKSSGQTDSRKYKPESVASMLESLRSNSVQVQNSTEEDVKSY